MIPVMGAIYLDDSELEERFIRSSGPGGQNVNKVATAVQLRFNALASPNLPERVKERLKALAGSRLTQDGVLVITAQTWRTQEANRREALERLLTLLRAASERERPRRPTRPTRASQTRRLDGKTHHGSLKAQRRQRPDAE
ncbi:alternative ribosome rescue aminoacyl-tRNA hydrolase ArfB [Pararhodospirillum photometricum]|uniref:Class I peptide chain release factor n=1 Tax=Pararhodospirillum photometricum DSM 122 TaxID=1150469 RepID=H6SJ59_PARPM|nr:alternative ribosome rescue aminoacyl-tRNA hydrolase ArfB [Pararhodospirillum photometricum]CCG08024.1 Class I peptide chain release factor [Pararhodospirillum photometricum DSM 122]